MMGTQPVYDQQLSLDPEGVALRCPRPECGETFVRDRSWVRDFAGLGVGCPGCGHNAILPKELIDYA